MRRQVFFVGGAALITAVAGVAVAASASTGTVTYEAEAAANRLTGGAHAASCDRCSEGMLVTGVGNAGVLTMVGVMAEQDGLATVAIAYTADHDRTARISVNGALPTVIDFPGTRGSARPGTLRISAPLRTGANSIRFENPAGTAPDIDKIVIATDGTPPTPKPTAPTSSDSSPAARELPEAEVIRLVNDERAKAGCEPVTEDARLTAAARKHSTDMAERAYFSHVSPDGADFADRLTSAGYQWSGAGENIAKGQRTPADVMASWMGSRGHRDNIVNCELRDIGVGVATGAGGALLWTQDFASEQ